MTASMGAWSRSDTANGLVSRRGIFMVVVAMVVGLPAVVLMDLPASAVPAAAAVTSPPPPEAMKNQPYSHQFFADGPVSGWRVVAGALPSGLTLDPISGVLAGTPATAGSFGPVTVAATPQREPLAAGPGHTCGLRLDGSVHCWGDNQDGQSADQPGPYTTVAAGGYHTCGLRVDGSAHCWGFNGTMQAVDQPGPYTTITAGWDHTCGLRPDGSAHCWGSNRFGQADDQPGPYTTITAARSHTCGLRVDGSVHCWGDNQDGQSADQPGPYITITAGTWHTCGLRGDGSAHCWGLNVFGQAADQPGPYTTITAGSHHTCGFRPDGSAHCWGLNDFGQADDQVGPYALAIHASLAQTFTLEVRSQPPAIGTLADRTIDQDGSAGPWAFLVSDDDDLPGSLVVSATSSDQAVVPDENVVVTGSGGVRSLSITPAPGITGTATITLTVTDPGGESTSSSFVVRVVPASASISGTVTLAGSGVGGVIVAAYGTGDGFAPTAATVSDVTGAYDLGGLMPGSYRLAFLAPSATGASVAWWSDTAPGGAVSREAATPISVASTADAHDGITVDLAAAASLSGTVTDTDGGPVEGVVVRAWRPSDTWLPTAQVTTEADGTYTLAGLAPGDFRIQFAPAVGSPLQGSWHDGATGAAGATVHTLAAGQNRAGIDAQLAEAAAISGTVVNEAGIGVAGATVMAYRDSDTWAPTALVNTDGDGTFTLAGLPAGTYRLHLVPPTGTTLQRAWHGGTTRATATALVAALGNPISDIETTLTP